MKYLSSFIFFLCLFLLSQEGFSQKLIQVEGEVLDTANNPINGARVLLINNKDSLLITSNKKGVFSFSKMKIGKGELIVSNLGYEQFQAPINIDNEINTFKIILKEKAIQLEEVLIKKKPNPVRVMQDTIEYDADAFNVVEGDNMADLIKQLPGLEVDEEYGVKTNGKPVIKLRVNGEDFFTSDVAEFIKKLPAGIASKIQIIDDYGDQANFTGIKNGEPTKLINIETKEGMDRGRFGNAYTEMGTNSKINTSVGFNFFKKGNQRGIGGGYSTENNGAGNSQGISGNFFQRNKLGEKGSYNYRYNFNNNSSAFNNERFSETLSTLGTYYNNSMNSGDNGGSFHNLSGEIRNQTEKWFINNDLSFSFRKQSNFSISVNDQTGAIKQGFKNSSNNENKSPNIGYNLNLTRKLNGGKNNISGNFSYNTTSSQSIQSIISNTLYYDQQDGSLLKDSLLNRILDNDNRSNSFSFGTGYTLSLGKKEEEKKVEVKQAVPTNNMGIPSPVVIGPVIAFGPRRNGQFLSFSYNFSLNSSTNGTSTTVLDPKSLQYYFVDSLSSNMKSQRINQNFVTNYNYSKNKFRMGIGFNFNHSKYENEYKHLNQTVENRNLNYSPRLNFSQELDSGKTVSLNYNGSNIAPNDMQLMPVPNTQNLQNIIIGNPLLKPFFQHRIGVDFNRVKLKTGQTFMFGANANTTQNEIVENIIIIPDTLGSFKRETRYLNGNGTYNLGSHYNMYFPMKKNTIRLRIGGNVGLSKKLLFIDSEKYFNEGLNFSQNASVNFKIKTVQMDVNTSYGQMNNNNVVGLSALGEMQGVQNPVLDLGRFTTTNFFKTKSFSSSLNARYNSKKINLNTDVRYSINHNENPDLIKSNREIQNINLSLRGNFEVFKSYKFDFHSSKNINTGYALANQNPFLISIGFGKMFLKNKNLHLTASVRDLLNQSDRMSRQVIGNSVVDSRSKVIGRVFLMSLRYDLSSFGAKGMHMRVDPD